MKKILHYLLLSFALFMLVACGKPDSQKAFEERFKEFDSVLTEKMKSADEGSKKMAEIISKATFKVNKVEEKGENSDLVPYWSLANINEETIKIERIVPMYPMSKDQVKYNRLIKVLSLYRLTLGQPRQEELLNSLGSNFDNEDNIDDLFINLSPFKHSNENNKSFV